MTNWDYYYFRKHILYFYSFSKTLYNENKFVSSIFIFINTLHSVPPKHLIMKTFKLSLFPLTVLLLLIATTSCKKTTLHPSEQSLSSANVKNASSNKSVPFKFQNRIDLSNPRYIEFNSCTGEIINIK